MEVCFKINKYLSWHQIAFIKSQSLKIYIYLTKVQTVHLNAIESYTTLNFLDVQTYNVHLPWVLFSEAISFWNVSHRPHVPFCKCAVLSTPKLHESLTWISGAEIRNYPTWTMYLIAFFNGFLRELISAQILTDFNYFCLVFFRKCHPFKPSGWVSNPN